MIKFVRSLYYMIHVAAVISCCHYFFRTLDRLDLQTSGSSSTMALNLHLALIIQIVFVIASTVLLSKQFNSTKS